MSTEKLILTVADHIIIGAAFIVSTLIGLLYQFLQKDNTNKDYLLAGKNMPVFPVILSLMATFMSATTLMGIPVDTYLYGTNMLFMNVGFIVGPIIAAYVFIPVYFVNDVSTVYEYIEKRFGRTLRLMLSAASVLLNVLFNSATLYAPSLALSAVTNISLWVSIITIGVVCTFYSTLGGMKAVLWTDAFQAILMFISLFAIIIKGTMDAQGIQNVFYQAYEGGRILLPKFPLDMSAQYTMTNILLLGIIVTLSSYGGTQVQVQRMLTLKSLKESKIAIFWSIPFIVALHMLCVLTGMVFYAYFLNCDPISAPNKPIEAPDQLMPYFITIAMRDYPALPGLCIAGIFSASLSTISSILNCLAAVTIEDFIRPMVPNLPHEVLLTKITSFIYGAICIGFAFAMSSIGTLIKMNAMIVGMFSGANLGVFLLAVCSKCANEQGAISGFVISLVIAAFLSFSPRKEKSALLPLFHNCTQLDNTTTTYPNTTTALYSSPSLTPLSKNSTMETKEETFEIPLSYMWISSISFFICLVVGYLSSAIISYFKKNEDEVPDKYLSPVRTWFSNRNSSKKSNQFEKTVITNAKENISSISACEMTKF